MTDSPQPSRPQQVTTAVVISVAACVLAVVNLFNTRDHLRGASFRSTLTDAQERAGGLGISNERLVSVLEVLVFVSGALAAVAAVLAVYAWQRNRAAWIGFFVSAGLLVFTLPVAGVVPVLLLAAGATFLASKPARDWFAGRAPATPATAGGPQLTLSQDDPGSGPVPGRSEPPPYPGRFGGGSSAVPPGSGDPAAPGTSGPGQGDPPPAFGPWHGGAAGQPGETPSQPYAQPSPPPSSQPYPHQYGQQPGQQYGQQYAQAGYPPPGYDLGPPPYGRASDKRPGTVTAACVVTWVGSALVAALIGIVSLVLLADRTRFLREFQRQADDANLSVSQDEVLAITWTVVGIGLFWCLAAAVLAALAFRRSRAGRIGLAVSAAMTVLVSLVLILSFVAVLPLLLGIAVLVLLFTGGANDWYARRPSSSRFSGGPPQPYPGQPSQPWEPPQQTPQQPPPPPSGHKGPW